MLFTLISNFKPQGDQPQAIEKLAAGLKENYQNQVLLGVTGSGKTYTMAAAIEKTQLPTLVISPNKTLAAQLYQEFKEFFPRNAVRYFVSYYDYYQPEAYIPETQTYIEKDARINAEIDRLRHAALQSLLTRRDTIIVASVSCIYGLGDPEEYQKIRLALRVGQSINPKDCLRHLDFIQYTAAETKEAEKIKAGQYWLEKNILTVRLVTGELIKIEFAKNRIAKIHGWHNQNIEGIDVYPAKFWVAPSNKLRLAIRNIKTELEERTEELQAAGKFEEAERLEKRVKRDMALLEKNGYVNGIENYSRHLSFRRAGEPPLTLLDYFPRPFLLFVDESHITVPQLQGMYTGDFRRKLTLVDYGFRLPSALDNRPLKFEEFLGKIGQTVYVSATPGPYELKKSEQVVEQLVRPTGIIDPEIIVRTAKNQIADLVKEIQNHTKKNQRIIALTLTKRSAEDLTEYLSAKKIKAHYIHSEIKTLQRPNLLHDLRRGHVDVIVGINLLREGLDLPEVGLVAILDADREGFLRNYRSIIQMAGRAARSTDSKVILYADYRTQSIKKAIAETNRRRKIQTTFNKKMGITPQSIKKDIRPAFSPAAISDD